MLYIYKSAYEFMYTSYTLIYVCKGEKFQLTKKLGMYYSSMCATLRKHVQSKQ